MANESDKVINFPDVGKTPRAMDPQFIELVVKLQGENLSPQLREWFEPENAKELNEAYFDLADVYHEMLVSPEIGGLDDEEALERWSSEQAGDAVGTMQSVVAMGLYKRELVDEAEADGLTLEASKIAMDRRLHGIREDKTQDPIALSETLAYVEQVRERTFG